MDYPMLMKLDTQIHINAECFSPVVVCIYAFNLHGMERMWGNAFVHHRLLYFRDSIYDR